MSLGLSVLSLSWHISKTHVQTSLNFCICYTWPWFGPSPTTMQYAKYNSGFVDDVMFSRNGPNTDTDLESATQRIMFRDPPRGAAYTPFTRYNRLLNRFGCQTGYPTGCQTGLYNRFVNRVERTATVRSTGCQTRLYNRFDNRLYTRYSRLTTACLTTGLTTACIV